MGNGLKMISLMFIVFWGINVPVFAYISPPCTHGYYPSGNRTLGCLPLRGLNHTSTTTSATVPTTTQSVTQEHLQQAENIRHGYLFFIIPVNVRFVQKLDDATGQVISTSRPWWSWFVKF